MLIRREVLMQLIRVEVEKLSGLKLDWREFEQYTAVNCDYENLKTGSHRSAKSFRGSNRRG
jgi:hypothetical protein